MRTTFQSDKLLNHGYRAIDWVEPATVYAAGLTAVTDAEAGTVTETTYAGYARAAAAFGAPAGASGGRRIQNSGTISLGQKTDAGLITLIAVGIYDAASAGNLTDIIYLDDAGFLPIAVVALAADLAADLLQSPGHGLAADDQVRFETFPGGPTLPAGLSENTTYHVIATGLTADAFKVSTTQGGGAVDITAIGKGILMRLKGKTVSQNDTPQFAANQLSIFDD